MCNNFLSTFPFASCFAIDRDLSHHSPIILRARCDDFGPPPFKLLNSLMLKDGFDVIIMKVCSESLGYGPLDMHLLNTLKQLKMVIRCWKANTVKEENR